MPQLARYWILDAGKSTKIIIKELIRKHRYIISKKSKDYENVF
jgi:hypothetical protein